MLRNNFCAFPVEELQGGALKKQGLSRDLDTKSHDEDS